MDGTFVLFLGRRTMETALLLASPILVVAVLVGFSTALFQAVTSVRDMTLSMVFKIVAVGLAALAFGGWMCQIAIGFTTEIFNHMAGVAP
ncbi:MAG: flagellar biosynthetic protein FliQ [Planctomycetota bacterium]|jgi:flagellar biosynthetic protein FliQ